VIAVVDYGASNVKSVLRALAAVGAEAALTADPAAVRAADRVVVPGVGNFAPAMRALNESGLGDAVRESARTGRPTLGICLGLQLFMESSEEAPGTAGLGLLRGTVIRFRTDLVVPHVGWARVRATEAGKRHPVMKEALKAGEAFYYHVHSYHPDGVPRDVSLANAEYGATFPTILGCDSVLGVQFHPEKSQEAGLALLRAFAHWKP
jgi:imidazole glycerol phosphate synthase glutamine amidotransferase subunit